MLWFILFYHSVVSFNEKITYSFHIHLLFLIFINFTISKFRHSTYNKRQQTVHIIPKDINKLNFNDRFRRHSLCCVCCIFPIHLPLLSSFILRHNSRVVAPLLLEFGELVFRDRIDHCTHFCDNLDKLSVQLIIYRWMDIHKILCFVHTSYSLNLNSNFHYFWYVKSGMKRSPTRRLIAMNYMTNENEAYTVYEAILSTSIKLTWPPDLQKDTKSRLYLIITLWYLRWALVIERPNKRHCCSIFFTLGLVSCL